MLLSFPDLFIVDLRLSGSPGNQRLTILIDGDSGMDIDQCASISRMLGARIEEAEVFADKYFLEVSSPGVDTPLKLLRQYVKNIGRGVKVELQNGEKLNGELTQVQEK